MSAPGLIDWSREDWGGHVYIATWAPDPRHEDATGDEQ